MLGKTTSLRMSFATLSGGPSVPITIRYGAETLFLNQTSPMIPPESSK
jgi:hypothetical protein